MEDRERFEEKTSCVTLKKEENVTLEKDEELVHDVDEDFDKNTETSFSGDESTPAPSARNGKPMNEKSYEKIAETNMKIVKEYKEKEKDKEDETGITTLIQKVRNWCLSYYQLLYLICHFSNCYRRRKN